MALNLTRQYRLVRMHGVKSIFFHIGHKSSGNHNIEAIDHKIPLSLFENILNNPDSLAHIRKATGAVIRPKYDNKVEVIDDEAADLLIVGNAHQIRKAKEQLLTFASPDAARLEVSEAQISDKLIWHGYKRNFKGQYAPAKPRKKCIRCGGKMISGNPCPLCQIKLKSDYDIHFTDVEILKQFICPYTWDILQPSMTGVCKMQQTRLEAAIKTARLHGYLPFTMPLPGHKKPFVPAGVPTDAKIKYKIH